MAGELHDELPVEKFDAIYEAALTITSELSLPIVLNRIVVLARDLVQARYAALGIPDSSGDHLVQFITSGISSEEQAHIGSLPHGHGLLGALLEPNAQPVRLSNMLEDARHQGFPENHPQMRSFLGIPIRSRGNLLGNLYLAEKTDGKDFTELDQRVIEMLAGYAAVAIENARMHQKIRRLTILEERERIGMDLHDGIIQSIYAVGLMLEHVELLMAEEDVPSAQGVMDNAISGLNMIIKDIRNYILDLRPTRFQGTDLSSALTRLMNEFQSNTLAAVKLDYQHSAINGNLSESTASTAFHIVQEALANAAKHAAATLLSVSVSAEDDTLLVTVKDNGRGFSQADTEQRLGHGLSNMQLRTRSSGGVLEVSSEPGVGTEVVVRLPLAGRHSE